MSLTELPIKLEQALIEKLHRVCEYEKVTFDELINYLLKEGLKDVLFIDIPK